MHDGRAPHLYVDSAGNVRPCVFLPVSFGNIMTEDFTPIFQRMRKAIPGPLHAPCPSLQLVGSIRSAITRDALPIRFEHIEREWKDMFRERPGAGEGSEGQR